MALQTALPDPNLRPGRFTGPNWNGVRAIVRREILRELLFFKLALLGPALQAALFAAVFSLAAGDAAPGIGNLSFLAFLAPGLILSTMAHKAFESTAYSFVYDKTEGILGDIFGAPVTSWEILLGYVATAAASGLIIGLTAWLALMPFVVLLPVHPLVALFFAIASVVILGLAGLLAGIDSDKWDSIAAKDVFVVTPLTFLSGAFFPLSALSEPFQTLMLYNPLFHLIDGFRYAMTGQAEGSPAIAALVVLGLIAVLTLAAHRVLQSGYKIKL